MTQFHPPTIRSDPPHGADARGAPRRTVAIFIALIALAIVGGAGYRLMSGPIGGPARAQDPATRENAPTYTRDGELFTVPETSPLRGKLAIAPVADKEIQRSLVLPAVVEADPSRTVKVLPAVAGRVVELKADLGARVAVGDVLAVIESGDLAQAFSVGE
jgi:multidrug efflux pump subunit AcrA (membrane-fusion protein)